MRFKLTFDVKLIHTLTEELSVIEDKMHNEEVSELLESFNSKLVRSTDLEGIEDYITYCDRDVFIKGLLTPTVIIDRSITKDEFVELIDLVMNAEGEEYEIDYWLEILSTNLTSSISDLIFWPEDGEELSAEEIYEKAIDYRDNNVILL